MSEAEYLGLTANGLVKIAHDLETENAALRELVQDMWRDGMCDCDEQYTCAECEYGYHERMRELGIEVERRRDDDPIRGHTHLR